MKREEAKDVIAAIVALREKVADELALEVPALYPKWREGVRYEAGKRVLHDGVLYKVNEGMGHTSQVGWEPGNAPSLFATVLTSDDGTPLPWVQPDSTNPYMKGDKVLYEGEVYESCIDYNTHEPTEQNVALGIWTAEEDE